MKIKIKKLNPETKLPSFAHPGDAGMDVFALKTKTLKPTERAFFYCGFSLEVENGSFGSTGKK